MSENPLLEARPALSLGLASLPGAGVDGRGRRRKGLTLRLPYSQAIIGNPESGVVHGGAITTLMDTTCGISTVCVLPDFEICPTLDLRIDYMHPAEPHKDVYGFAECYRVTPNVIFTRGFAYQDDPGQPIAHVVGAFMRMGGSARAGAARPAAQGGAA